MVKLKEITSFLDKELKIKKIKDTSINGLQFKSGNEVKKVGFAVDGCLSTFKKAKKEKIDLLIVHHGIKWKPQKSEVAYKKRISFLKNNKFSLYGAHLPLDSHPIYGNSAQIGKLLTLKKIKEFGKWKNGFFVGALGSIKPKKIEDIAKILNKKLKTKCEILKSTSKKVKSIAIVSGYGPSLLEEAIKKKADCFIVGEISEGDYRRILDSGQNTIVAGHYATETTGPKALQTIIKKKFSVKTIFINDPISY